MNPANVVLDQPHLIDTLRFRVQVEKSLPQETVRIGVRVLVIVRGSDRDSAALESRVREALGLELVFDKLRQARAGFGFDLGKEGLELVLHHLKECRFPFAHRCSSADEFEPNCAIASAR